jgi:hypothetical protein
MLLEPESNAEVAIQNHPIIENLEEFSKQLQEESKNYYIAYKKYKKAYFSDCDE